MYFPTPKNLVYIALGGSLLLAGCGTLRSSPPEEKAPLPEPIIKIEEVHLLDPMGNPSLTYKADPEVYPLVMSTLGLIQILESPDGGRTRKELTPKRTVDLYVEMDPDRNMNLEMDDVKIVNDKYRDIVLGRAPIETEQEVLQEAPRRERVYDQKIM